MKMARPNLTLVILTLTFLGPFHSKSAEESLVGGLKGEGKLIFVTNEHDRTLNIYSSGRQLALQDTVYITEGLPRAVAASGRFVFVISDDDILGIYYLYSPDDLQQVKLVRRKSRVSGVAASGEDLFVVDSENLNRYRIAFDDTGLIENLELNLMESIKESSVVGVAASGKDLFIAKRPGTVNRYRIEDTGLTLIANSEISAGADSIAVSGQDLFVTNSLDGALRRYRIEGVKLKEIEKVDTGPPPVGVAALGKDVFVTNFINNTLGWYRIDGTNLKFIKDIKTGSRPSDVAVVKIPTQREVEKAIQEAQPTITKDIAQLIAQFTTSHVDVLEELLYRFIKSGTFDMSAAIGEVSKLRGSEEKKSMIIFNELLLPFMVARGLDAAHEALQEFNQRYPQELNRVQEAIASRLKSTTEELDRAQAELEDMTLRASYEVGVGEEQVAPLRTKVAQLKETQERLDNILRYISQMRPSIPRSM